MTIYHVGTAGWDYKDWIGPFYPKNLHKFRHLTYYAKYFDFIEVNSSFYNLPNLEITENWNSQVSETFKFSLKVWQNITHEYNNPRLSLDIDSFILNVNPLGDKLVSLILQFPPWFKYSEKHKNQLIFILNEFPDNYRLVVELRHNSWFEENDFNFIENKRNAILCTSYIQNVVPFYNSNQNWYYIRLIGDREITKFNSVQNSRKMLMKHFFSNIKELSKKSNVSEIFIIVNNHFSGFAPETANEIKKELNLPFKGFSQQMKLNDYLK